MGDFHRARLEAKPRIGEAPLKLLIFERVGSFPCKELADLNGSEPKNIGKVPASTAHSMLNTTKDPNKAVCWRLYTQNQRNSTRTPTSPLFMHQGVGSRSFVINDCANVAAASCVKLTT